MPNIEEKEDQATVVEPGTIASKKFRNRQKGETRE